MVRRRSYLATMASGAVGALFGIGSGAALPVSVGSPARTERDEAWTQETKLVADDGDRNDRFGFWVALDDGTGVVGAPRDENPNGRNAGAAYAFDETAGAWNQDAKLTAEDGERGDRFGFQVAVDDGTALIGARFDDTERGDTAGSAYVFTQTEDGWTQQTKLIPDDGDEGDRFGRSVALDGTTAVIGAITDEDPNGPIAGSAYVFERSGDTWSQQAKLTADDGDPEDQFGVSVALDSGTAIVGADDDEDPNGEAAGSAYVFERDGTTWTQQAKLTADDGSPGDGFGLGLAIDGSTALVGAPNNEGGSVYVFDRADGGWPRTAKLTAADGAGGDRFGISVDIVGTTALIGADQRDTTAGTDAGAVAVFERSDGTWSQQATLTAGDGDAGDRFGYPVALDGTRALIGARDDEDPNGSGAGSAYVFTRPEGTTTLEPAFSVTPDMPTVGEEVTLDASASTADGSIVSYAWDVDDDGTIELSGSTPTTVYTFERPGEYTVALSVTDDTGATATTSRTVTVTESDGDRSVRTYADERGVVTTEGLRAAVADWSSREIPTSLLQRVVAAWSSGDPVSVSGTR